MSNGNNDAVRLNSAKVAPELVLEEFAITKSTTVMRVPDEDDVDKEEVTTTIDGAVERSPVKDTDQDEWDRCQIDHLMLQCARQKFGLVYPLRNHAAGRAVFTSWVWSDAEVEDYLNTKKSPCELSKLSPLSPVIYLVFAHADLLTLQNPETKSGSAWFYAAGAHAKSMWIIDYVPLHLQYKPHGQFVVPSEALDNDHMRDLVSGNDKQRGTFSHNGPIRLTNNEALEVYATEAGTQASKLQEMFNYNPNEKISYGDAGASLRQVITPKDYFYQVRDMA